MAKTTSSIDVPTTGAGVDFSLLINKSTIILVSLGLIVVIYGLLNVTSETGPMDATIETEIPMLGPSNIGLSLNGGLAITAPNTPGHWEIEGSYFTDSNEAKFCFIDTIGIQRIIFIPDDPNITTSSVYSVVFVWRAYIQKIQYFLFGEHTHI